MMMVKTERITTVTDVLYQARGCPDLDKPATFGDVAMCGSCHRHREVTAASKVLTSQFGSWDEVTPDDGKRWLCLPCASAYRAPELRRRSTFVRSDGQYEQIDVTRVRDLLTQPIPADAALIIPLSGKKIVAPRATWGALTTDQTTFQWTARHKRLLGYGLELRALGFTENALKEPSPTFQVLSDLPPHQHAHVQHMWREWQPLREDKTLLPLFLFLTRKVTS